MYYVYIILNIINYHLYVGKTGNPKYRWSQHILTANETSKCRKLYTVHKALKKYGIDNFQYQCISAFDTSKEAYQAERWWIQHFKQHNCVLYNETEGGESGPRHCKLNESNILEIKFLLKCGCAQSTIAARFNVSRSAILSINIGRTWGYITLTSEKEQEFIEIYGDNIETLQQKFAANKLQALSAAHIGQIAHNKGKVMSEKQKLSISGERNHSAKLTDIQVKEIKQLIKCGMKSGQIATQYSVSRPLITRIKMGKTWNNVQI